jgi:hypothetical protein
MHKSMHLFSVKMLLVILSCLCSIPTIASDNGLMTLAKVKAGGIQGSCELVLSGAKLCHSECEVQNKLCQRQCVEGEAGCLETCMNQMTVACCQQACDDKYSSVACALDEPTHDCDNPASAHNQNTKPAEPEGA